MEKKDLIKYIAYYMYFMGTSKTNYGSYRFYFDTLAEEIGCDVAFLRENYDEICNILESHIGVIDVWGKEETGDECFDINFGTSFCGVDDYDNN